MKKLALVLLLTLAGCGVCGQAAHRNDPQCVILHDVVDCTTDAVTSTIPQFIPIVMQLIAQATGADGSIDWPKVEASLLGLGVRDGLCILTAIGEQFASAAPTAGPTAVRRAQSYQAGLAALRAKKWPGVHAKIRAASGEVVIR